MSENVLIKADSALMQIYDPQTKPSDRLMMMIQRPEVQQALSRNEAQLLNKAAGQQIRDIDDNELVQKLRIIFHAVSLDIGFIEARCENWEYLQTRMFQIIRQNYSDLTPGEIKNAFELLILGELDEYLPKNSQGQPEKNHYQQFNIDYLVRVLTAYNAKKRKTIIKANGALPPPPQRQMTQAERNKMVDADRIMCIIVFLQYKYTGILDFKVSPRSIWDWLNQIDYVEGSITDGDRTAGTLRYMERVRSGLINQFTARENLKSKSSAPIANETHNAFIERAIKANFDKMISDEVQVLEITPFRTFRYGNQRH